VRANEDIRNYKNRFLKKEKNELEKRKEKIRKTKIGFNKLTKLNLLKLV
jgi:hypothetical protein